MSSAAFTVILDAEDLEDRLDALYYFMKYKLRKTVRDALYTAQNAGYCRVFKLQELVKHRKAYVRPTKSPGSLFYLIEAEDVDGVTGEITRVKTRKGEDFAETQYPTCRPGDLIYLRIRPYLRKVALVPEELLTEEERSVDLRKYTICCSGEFYVLTPKTTLITLDLNVNSELLMKYLWVYLRSELTLFQVLPLIVGATRPRVGLRDFLNILVALPTTKEVIEEIVKKAMHVIGKIKRARRELINAIKETQSLLGVDITWLATGSKNLAEMSDDLIDLLFESGLLSRGFFMGLDNL